MNDAKDLRERVSRDYARILDVVQPKSCCPGLDTPGGPSDLAGYGEADFQGLPDGVKNSSFGCGNPVALSGIRAGETILDLGSGAGLDLLIAAQKVGPSGRVIGVDMTDEMIEKARANVAEAGLENVEIRKGIIEELPVDDASVDWVISNCVINLSPEKDKVFAEIARVLKPGGRMRVSDIVVNDLPEWALKNKALYSGCVAGAIGEAQYVEGLKAAGLREVEVPERLVYSASQLATFLQLEVTGAGKSDPCSCSGFLTGKLLGRAAEGLQGKVWSAVFTAAKP